MSAHRGRRQRPSPTAGQRCNRAKPGPLEIAVERERLGDPFATHHLKTHRVGQIEVLVGELP